MLANPKDLEEIQRRRTFAVVSHPDAGKTTITERFLLAGRVIREAGHVKAKSGKKFATSDWMEIERKRGISVTSSVLSFPYMGKHINLVDTPGHEDFCEDTYRALTAVDSALVLIDAAKGVEPQTIKLMDVCRLRKTPIMVFINKMDREARPPLELMDEIEKILGVACAPMTLPLGQGVSFEGCYGVEDNKVRFFKDHGSEEDTAIQVDGPGDPRLDEWFSPNSLIPFRENFELVQGAMDRLSVQDYLSGAQAPVFFGSALREFGIHHLLTLMTQVSPAPQSHATTAGIRVAEEEAFSGYVFKIQANMDARHRDRIAYLRVCSGRCDRGAKVYHVRHAREIKLATPTQFMAQDKAVVESAFAGDIIGIHDPGYFNIGDTLTLGESFQFEGIPDFPSEHFMRVVLEDPLTGKKLQKGLMQLSEEGAVQLFIPSHSSAPILGVVGPLQFDVIKFRLDSEYGAKCRMEGINIFSARWLIGEQKEVESFCREHGHDCAKDKMGNAVYLCPNEFRMQKMIENYPKIKFEAIRK